MGHDGRLSKATLELWKLASALIWREVSYDHAEARVRGGWALEPHRERVSRLITEGTGRWDAAVDVALAMEHASPARLDNPCASAMGPEVAAALECLRLGMMVATGRSADIPAAQASAVRRALDGHAMLRPLAPAPAPRRRGTLPDAGATTVTFAHAYRQAGPSGRGARTLTLATGSAPLLAVSAHEAPPVARLVGLRCEAIVVRVLGDGFVRPVFAPGSQEPLDVAAFRDAALSGDPWEDNPFLARPSPGRVLAGLRSVAFPPSGRAHRNDADAEARAARDCVARAAGLVVVDGIVHRAAEAPTLHLAPVPSGHDLRGYRVAWRMGGDDMLRGGSPFGDDAVGGDLLRDGLRGDAGSVAFGPGEADQLADVVRACSAEAGEPFPVRFRDAPAVSWVDRATFPERPDAVLEHVAAMARAGSTLWSGVPGLGEAMSADGEGLAAMAAHMSALADAFAGPSWKHPTAPGIGLDAPTVARGLLRVAAAQALARAELDLAKDALADFVP